MSDCEIIESEGPSELDSLFAEVTEQSKRSALLLGTSNGTLADVDASTAANNDELEAFDHREVESGVTVFELSKQENCIHEVAVPRNIQFKRRERGITNPAKTFKFTLDPFQQEAIECVDQFQSVLVSAHTSAGKTVCGLYAIALALREDQRVIYTTPIKALSNQKYRELSEEFGDVGLMTGDVTLNPEASCIVMTTEILRSMLYRGSEIMREVGWVIFDEIHYMRDEERGVVWEETIILLPDNVHYVFLSATIPNAKHFATWIASVHNQICHIVYTDYRPTPLQHVFYSSGSNGLYEVVSVSGEFREEQFQRAMSFVTDTSEKEQSRQGRQQAMQQNSNNVTIIIRTIRERELLPCIVFSFSRKECEAYASSLRDMDFNDGPQKVMIKEIFYSALQILSEEDQKLPQIKWILPFLLRGIGIHHSGLLPLLKECIEILFGEGLLKVLFATETFSMGLNMPARTVLFTSARKFDGRDNRWITSGEYIQMSGRAGRRGLDSQGLVVLMVDQKMSADVAKNIVKGHTDPLNSQFRLTYNMVLNLTRVPEINPQYMMERSFRYFQNKMLLPPLYEKYEKKKRLHDEMKIDREADLASYMQLKTMAESTKAQIQKVVLQPKHLSPFLQAGRLFHVKTPYADLGWGVLLEYKKTVDKMSETIFVIEMAIRLSWDCVKDINYMERLRAPSEGQSGTKWIGYAQKREYLSSAFVLKDLNSCGSRSWIAIDSNTTFTAKFIPVELSCIDAVSSLRVRLPDKPDASEQTKESIGLTLKRALEKFGGQPPELDPVKDMSIKDARLEENITYLQKLEKEAQNHPLKKCKDFGQIMEDYERKMALHHELKSMRDEIKKTKNMFCGELEARQKLLRRMGYVDNYGNITQKGRIACEISSADEIVTTEMLFTGVFKDMVAADAAALLSCFIFEERSDKVPKLDDKLTAAFAALIKHAQKVAQVSVECNLDIIEKAYLEKFQSGIMPVVKQWCSGASFLQVSQDSGIFEGSIIRCLRRLEELLREMQNAVKSMGYEELAVVFETATKALKRNIVFAASLYL